MGPIDAATFGPAIFVTSLLEYGHLLLCIAHL